MRRLWKALRHETPGPADDRGAARHRRRGRAAGAGHQDLSPAAYRQVVAGARLARPGQRRHGAQRRARRRGACASSVRSQEKIAVGPARRGRRAGPHGGDRHRHGAHPVGQGRPLCRSPKCRSRSTVSRSTPRSAATTSSSPASIAKLIEEDPTLRLEQNAELREMVLWGQGDMHLQIAIDRLRNRHNLAVVGHHAAVPYKETITPRRPAAFALQAAERRPRPVRRHHDRGEAAAARLRLYVYRHASSAARSRATTSRRSRRASSKLCATGRSASRWSMSRSICSPASSTPSTARTWRSRPPAGRRSRKRCRNASRCCSSRSTRSRSRCRTPSPRACSASFRAGAARSSAIDAKPDWPGWDVVERATAAQRAARSDRRAALADPRGRQLRRASSTTCRS